MIRLSSSVTVFLIITIPHLVLASPLDTSVDNSHHLMWQVPSSTFLIVCVCSSLCVKWPFELQMLGAIIY